MRSFVLQGPAARVHPLLMYAIQVDKRLRIYVDGVAVDAGVPPAVGEPALCSCSLDGSATVHYLIELVPATSVSRRERNVFLARGYHDVLLGYFLALGGMQVLNGATETLSVILSEQVFVSTDRQWRF